MGLTVRIPDIPCPLSWSSLKIIPQRFRLGPALGGAGCDIFGDSATYWAPEPLHAVGPARSPYPCAIFCGPAMILIGDSKRVSEPAKHRLHIRVFAHTKCKARRNVCLPGMCGNLPTGARRGWRHMWASGQSTMASHRPLACDGCGDPLLPHLRRRHARERLGACSRWDTCEEPVLDVASDAGGAA